MALDKGKINLYTNYIRDQCPIKYV